MTTRLAGDTERFNFQTTGAHGCALLRAGRSPSGDWYVMDDESPTGDRRFLAARPIPNPQEKAINQAQESSLPMFPRFTI
ncbi:hypothetical protein MASR2M48_20650 [Spirochaetota bacterium]